MSFSLNLHAVHERLFVAAVRVNDAPNYPHVALSLDVGDDTLSIFLPIGSEEMAHQMATAWNRLNGTVPDRVLSRIAAPVAGLKAGVAA